MIIIQSLTILIRITHSYHRYIFTVEYLLRIWSASEDPDFEWCIEQESPVWFNYIFSFYALIDIIAIVPFYIEMAHLIPPQISGAYMIFIFIYFYD